MPPNALTDNNVPNKQHSTVDINTGIFTISKFQSGHFSKFTDTKFARFTDAKFQSTEKLH